MKPYSSARLEFEGKADVFLDANENSLGSVSETLHNRYPDPLQHAVKEKLSQLENVTAGQIFLGNGSDECIDVLIRTFCEPGEDSIIICPPVFGMYEHSAHGQNVQVKEVLLTEDFQLNTQEILNAAALHQAQDGKCKIIFICSPNNPTGNLMHEKDIERLLNEFDGIVLIDEAYQDFSSNISWVKRLGEFQNLAVIKTFSKAWGMADARLGMLFADETFIHYLNTVKLPYNVNQHTQQLALDALGKVSKKENFVEELNASRKYLQQELAGIHLVIQQYPTDANFILFKVEDADKVYNYLLKNGIVVRNRSKSPLCAGCLRVSVGTKEENEKFINALKNYQSK